jgi:NAD(P)-dependent dehydrogenase (short-subunit alcohol dehydrogenase family)
VSDIDGPAAEAVATEIAEVGARAFATTCDVTSRDAVDASIADTIGRFGKLNVLVNTAGGDWNEPALGEIPDELFDRKMDVNLTGVFRCVRAALPH